MIEKLTHINDFNLDRGQAKKKIWVSIDKFWVHLNLSIISFGIINTEMNLTQLEWAQLYYNFNIKLQNI